MAIIGFIISAIAVYLFYYIFIIRKYDEKGNRIIKQPKNSKLKTGKKKEYDQARYPAEVELFIYKYRIDLKKVNFKSMLKLLGLVCSIDVSLVVTILSFIKVEIIWQLLIGAVLVFPIIFISFSLLGKYFKKKGLTKHV